MKFSGNSLKSVSQTPLNTEADDKWYTLFISSAWSWKTQHIKSLGETIGLADQPFVPSLLNHIQNTCNYHFFLHYFILKSMIATF